MDAITYIADWLNSGTYTFFSRAAAYFIESAVYAYLQFMHWAIPFAWGIAKVILEDLQISQHINTAMSGFNADTMQLVNYLRFPEAVTTIATGGMTKLAFRFIPGF